MYKVLVIARDEIDLGFRLAGVKTHAVKNSEEAREKLVEQLDSKEYGIILLDDELTTDFDEQLEKRILESDFPLVMLIPLRKELKEEILEDEISKFASNIIGHRIRI
jgi:vacuolar-type H+-ATPase subunit F/Vma7